VQALGEAALFLGPVIYARTHPEWAVTQRLALLMEAAVMLMKAHSYIASNRHLRREVALVSAVLFCRRAPISWRSGCVTKVRLCVEG
jgi:hypothetical protein